MTADVEALPGILVAVRVARLVGTVEELGRLGILRARLLRHALREPLERLGLRLSSSRLTAREGRQRSDWPARPGRARAG